MPFAKRSTAPSQIDDKLKTKRQKIIEEERIRVLKEALLLFYDKLMEKYDLVDKIIDDTDEYIIIDRKKVEELAEEHANTKPIGF